MQLVFFLADGRAERDLKKLTAVFLGEKRVRAHKVLLAQVLRTLIAYVLATFESAKTHAHTKNQLRRPKTCQVLELGSFSRSGWCEMRYSLTLAYTGD